MSMIKKYIYIKKLLKFVCEAYIFVYNTTPFKIDSVNAQA